MSYNPVFVEKGPGGWGQGLHIAPTEEKNKVVSVTGGGIHPVAEQIAQATGAEVIDGFKSSVPDNEIACVIIDCGGTARIGLYPKKGILTVDVLASRPSGPLAKFITEENFVSGVTPNEITQTNGETAPVTPNQLDKEETKTQGKKEFQEKYAEAKAEHANKKQENILIRFSRGIGKVTGTFYEAGRESVDMLIKNIIPFIAFVSMLIGIINYSGLGDLIANTLSPLAGSIWGLLAIVFICTLPFLSPVLGPGAVVAQVVGVLIGSQIGMGAIPPEFALPALFAINGQVGADFVPVGLSLAEAEPETVEVGVPAVLYSRVLTGVMAVVIAYFASFGMY